MLRHLVAPPSTHNVVVTAIGATMTTLLSGSHPHFGLASDDEAGRAAAIEFARAVCDAVGRCGWHVA
jgi:hypothetical protein